MDNPFDISEWRPTKVPNPGDLERKPDDFTTLCSQLSIQTKNILRYPYDPSNWTARAESLSRLRYPELAVGDAYKAGLLCRAHIKRLDEGEGTEWRLGHRMGFWMKDPFPRHELLDDFDEEEYLDQLEQHMGKLQCRASKIEKRNLYFQPNFEEGRFQRRMYPWMPAKWRKRDDGLVERLNHEFKYNSANFDGKPFCKVRRNAFGGGDDVLGVFAGKEIFDRETILIDETAIWGCNHARTATDYECVRRTTTYNASYNMIDDTDEVIDLRWIQEVLERQAGPVLLNSRLLLSSINDIIEHPLDHPLISRLTPTYHEDRIETFVLLNDITIPNKALQQSGIDIFANHNYDTWVLFTIQARILNNSCGDMMAKSLNPLFALFNHSCEPNVEWTTTSKDHRTIKVRARRDIQKGEQLLVEYDQFMRDQPLEIRRKRMYRWLDGPCQCERCVREEEQRRYEVNVEPTWDDIPEKPVFPEDLLKN